MKWIIYSVMLLTSIYCQAQNSVETDETSDDYDIWALRTGIGIQHSPYLELGVARLFIHGSHFASDGFYTAMELNRRQNSSTPLYYGFKAGYEGSWTLLMFGIEAKYISDFKNDETFLLTPRAGVSLVGGLNLLYGYNFPKDLNSFPGIGNHQVSLTIHLSRKLMEGFFGEKASRKN